MSLSKRFEEFQPSKALWFWSTAGAVVLTMVVGFTAGGWVTGGTATEMADSARENGRAELAAQLCVNQFVAAPGAAAELAALKEASSWERDNFVEDGGWAVLAGNVAVIDGSIDLCAEKLAAMEALPEGAGMTEEATTSEPVADQS